MNDCDCNANRSIFYLFIMSSYCLNFALEFNVLYIKLHKIVTLLCNSNIDGKFDGKNATMGRIHLNIDRKLVKFRWDG